MWSSSSVVFCPGSELLADDGAKSAEEAAALLRACFPANFSEPSPSSSSLSTRSVLEDGLGFHDVEDAIWILVRSSGSDDREKLECSAAEDSGGRRERPLIALAAAVPYHDGLYVCNLCVHPRHRNSGLGLDVLEAAGHLTAEKGLDALIGNARTDDGGALQLYYERLGATVVRSGLGSGGDGGTACSHVRMRRTVGSTSEEVAELFAWLRGGRRRRRRARLVRRLAVSGVAVCGMVVVAFGLRRRKDSRAT